MSAPGPTPSIDRRHVELRARLARYPADRYPVQHASTSFQLGSALTAAGHFDEAEQALAVAAELFGPDRLPTEHAKALNARGAALRAAGKLDEAVTCFQAAVAVFERVGLVLERGAALFNLGLARRELGESPVDCFRRARDLLDADRVPGHAAAAARELGAALLTAGESAAAAEVLADAVVLAERARDLPGLGAALNTLGLAQLAQGKAQEAVRSFVGAVGGHPRPSRPDGYGMAKANLALAHEEAGEPVRARLAARQALGVSSLPAAVFSTASGVLERVGPGPGELLDVLDLEREEQWPAVVGEELARWSAAWPEDLDMETDAFVSGVLARPAGADMVAAWLGGLLELPPESMATLVVAMLRALGGLPAEQVERFRSLVARGCARFHVPQMQRMTQIFEELAAEHGGPRSWR